MSWNGANVAHSGPFKSSLVRNVLLIIAAGHDGKAHRLAWQGVECWVYWNPHIRNFMDKSPVNITFELISESSSYCWPVSWEGHRRDDAMNSVLTRLFAPFLRPGNFSSDSDKLLLWEKQLIHKCCFNKSKSSTEAGVCLPSLAWNTLLLRE